MNEPVFMNHFNDYFRECFTNLFRINFSHFQFIDLVNMKPINILHNQQFFSRFS